MEFTEQLESFLSGHPMDFERLFYPIREALRADERLVNFTIYKKLAASARSIAEEKIRENPLNVMALYLLAYVSYLKADSALAVSSLEKASELNFSQAMIFLGEVYCNGNGVEKNYDKAFALFERANELKNNYANYTLALMYLYGEGRPINIDKAVELLETAISQESHDAMYTRAKMHLMGRGGPVNKDMAAYLFRQAHVVKESQLGYPNDEALKALKALSGSFVIKYHQHAIRQNSNKFASLIKESPIDVLNLISIDPLLTKEEKYFHLLQILKHDPQIIGRLTSGKDQASLDLIGNYYFQLALDKLDAGKITEACEFFQKVPALSTLRGEACYHIANHLYMAEITKIESFAEEVNVSLSARDIREEAFWIAQGYLEEGCKLDNDGGCKHYYATLLQSLIDPEQDTVFNADLDQLKIDYQNMPRSNSLPTQYIRNLRDCYNFLEKGFFNSKHGKDIEKIIDLLKIVNSKSTSDEDVIYSTIKIIEDELIKQRNVTDFFNKPLYSSNHKFVESLNNDPTKHHYSRLLALTLHDLYQRYGMNEDRRNLLYDITERIVIPNHPGYEKFNINTARERDLHVSPHLQG